MSGKTQIVRIGPVHFQPLEWELELVSKYLQGHVLNAGCGNRDLRPYLLETGVERVTNYDMASTLEGAIVGSLDAMPFAAASFDSILCNAVLEHVASVDAVVRELVRVLRPGGYMVLAVPFLQPFHECPLDFRRYTRDGLVELGESAGLTSIAVHPVHSAAQTLGWIAWEIARERKSRVLQIVLWPIIYLATRIWLRTDLTVLRNANTYQVVFTRQ